MGIKHVTTKSKGEKVFALDDWNADHKIGKDEMVYFDYPDNTAGIKYNSTAEKFELWRNGKKVAAF